MCPKCILRIKGVPCNFKTLSKQEIYVQITYTYTFLGMTHFFNRLWLLDCTFHIAKYVPIAYEFIAVKNVNPSLTQKITRQGILQA